MSIIAVREIASGTGGSASDLNQREYTRTFIVITDNPLEGTPTVGSAFGLPRLFDPYVDLAGVIDYGSLCKKVTPRRRGDDHYTWDVTIEYSSRMNYPALARQTAGTGGSRSSPGSGGDGGGAVENPLLRPPEVSWEAQEYIEQYELDADGVDVRNSALDPIVLERDAARRILVIERNEAIFDATDLDGYSNKTNFDNWQGYPSGVWLCKPIKARSAYENSVYFFRVRYEFHHNRNGWFQKKRDQGFNSRALPGENKPRPILAKSTGTPYQTERFLDGFGEVLAVGEPPVYLQFRPYERKAFGPLGLPPLV